MRAFLTRRAQTPSRSGEYAMLRKYCPRVLPRLRSEPRRVNRFAAREVNQGPDAMNDFAVSFILHGTHDGPFHPRFTSRAAKRFTRRGSLRSRGRTRGQYLRSMAYSPLREGV